MSEQTQDEGSGSGCVTLTVAGLVIGVVVSVAISLAALIDPFDWMPPVAEIWEDCSDDWNTSVNECILHTRFPGFWGHAIANFTYARVILFDLYAGHDVFARSNAGRDEQHWYYDALATTFAELSDSPMAAELWPSLLFCNRTQVGIPSVVAPQEVGQMLRSSERRALVVVARAASGNKVVQPVVTAVAPRNEMVDFSLAANPSIAVEAVAVLEVEEALSHALQHYAVAAKEKVFERDEGTSSPD